MTVPAQPTKAIYAGDGVTTSFPITFQFADLIAGTDVWVYIIDNLGNGANLPIAANYAVNVAAKTVTYPVAGQPLPANWQIVLRRMEPLNQGVSLPDTGPLPPSIVEKALDLITMKIQQLQEQIDRATLAALNTPPVASPLLPATPINIPYYAATFPALQSIAALNPTQAMWGFATDLGAQGQLMFYCGNINAVGSSNGWYGPIAGA